MVVPFPFSVMSGSKLRPALVVASWSFKSSTDYLLCLISAQNAPDPYIISLDMADMQNGSLNRQSYLRPSYLFSVAESLIAYRACELTQGATDKASRAIIRVINPQMSF